jgi:DNA-binding transcriptional LysR family regulator
MEFRQVTTFLAIAEELHFGRAAARLHLAQSSVSQQLQRLEREIGVQLVARTSHDVRLTAAGMAFRIEAERLVEQAARAVRLARDVVAGRHGTINIGYNQIAGQWVLPATLLRLHEDYPNLVVHLWERLTGAQLEALAADELDVALVYGRPTARGLRSRHILDVPLVAAVPDGHPWAELDQARFAELASVPCVLPRRDRSPAVYDAVVSTAHRMDIDLCVVDEIDDPSAMGIVARTQQVIVFASGRAGTVRDAQRTRRDSHRRSDSHAGDARRVAHHRRRLSRSRPGSTRRRRQPGEGSLLAAAVASVVAAWQSSASEPDPRRITCTDSTRSLPPATYARCANSARQYPGCASTTPG